MAVGRTAPRRLSGVSALAGSALVLPLLAPTSWLVTTICYRINWEENPDTALLYSLARPELNLLSAFDFISQGSRSGSSLPTPPGNGTWCWTPRKASWSSCPPEPWGLTDSKARIIPMGEWSFEEVRRAPSDTTLTSETSRFPWRWATSMSSRPRTVQGFYGRHCVYLRQVRTSRAGPRGSGPSSFLFDVSPECNGRKLYPPKN